MTPSRPLRPSRPAGLAPAFRWSPSATVRLNRTRLLIDTVGVVLVRLFTPLLHSPTALFLLGVYNIMAWATILTVDSTRLPEFSSTRLKQRQAWRFTARRAPLLIIAIALMALAFHLPLLPAGWSGRHLLGLVVPAYMDELLFRNLLQPSLRKAGMSRSWAIVAQSLLFSVALWLQTRSVGIAAMAFMLGVFNGWMVSRFRSLWPAFALGLLWRALFL